jgi:hypothetical protein
MEVKRKMNIKSRRQLIKLLRLWKLGKINSDDLKKMVDETNELAIPEKIIKGGKKNERNDALG